MIDASMAKENRMNGSVTALNEHPLGAPLVGELPVAIIGAGPIGLAAAIHLLSYGLDPLIIEAGAKVGAGVREWGHVPMFSSWGLNLDRAAVARLRLHGWTSPPDDGFPTGGELVERYLEPLAVLPEIAQRLRLGTRVVGIGRAGHGKVKTPGRQAQPFEIHVVHADGSEGRLHAGAVLDASGTWLSPTPAGASGLPAPGERAAADRIRYGMPDVLGSDRSRYAGKRVLVLGGGDSAIGCLLSLAELMKIEPSTRVTWAIRRSNLQRSFGGGAADQLPQRGALGSQLKELVEQDVFEPIAPFALERIERQPDGSLVVIGGGVAGEQKIETDELIVATGLRPDLSFLRELRLDLDPALDCTRALAPLIDPNEHSCGTVPPHGAAELAQPEPGFFIIGMKSYGRAPTFLLATGHEQARSVAAHLAGDEEAARRVELVLPETGVCSGPSPAKASSCCGGPAPADAKACCALDATAKEEGLAGCGCGDPRPEPALATACCS
jgi:thioredoxin reductase